MTKRKPNPKHLAFIAVRPPQDYQLAELTTDRSESRIAVRIIRLGPGDKVEIAHTCLCLLVHAFTRNAGAPSISIHSGSGLIEFDKEGEVMSLASGGLFRSDESSGGDLVLYEIPKASFRNFASDHNNATQNSFAIPEPREDAFLMLLSRSVYPLLSSNAVWSRDFAHYFATALYLRLLERYGVRSLVAIRSVGGLSPRNKALVDTALQTSQGVRLRIETLAEMCKISTRQFARAFRQSFGMPFYRFQLDLRIRRAKQLLILSNESISEIADQLGYADQATFTEGFARITGMPPGRYRRQHKPSDSGSL